MKILVRLVLAAIGGFLAMVFSIPKLPFPLSLICWGLLAWGIWWILGLIMGSSKPATSNASGSWPADFTPTVAHRNIAIDAAGDRLWVRPVSGAPRVMNRGEVKAWTHEWLDAANAYGMRFKVKNFIVIRTPDIQNPILKVGFGRDYKTAADWQARITNWVNE